MTGSIAPELRALVQSLEEAHAICRRGALRAARMPELDLDLATGLRRHIAYAERHLGGARDVLADALELCRLAGPDPGQLAWDLPPAS